MVHVLFHTLQLLLEDNNEEMGSSFHIPLAINKEVASTVGKLVDYFANQRMVVNKVIFFKIKSDLTPNNEKAWSS